MKELNRKVKIFADDKFRIVVVETSDAYEAWIGYEDCGVYDFAFGKPKYIERSLDTFAEGFAASGTYEEAKAKFLRDHSEY